MPRSPEVPVNPRVLVWARETDGASLSDVAKHLDLTESEVREMEAGERLPQAKHVRALAKYLHRSLPTMLLPEPPAEPDLPQELRTPTGAAKSMARHTRQAIRTAREVQDGLRELAPHTDELVQLGYEEAALHADAAASAAAERARLGLAAGYQRQEKDALGAFRASREIVEGQGVVTLMLHLDRKDARGIALTDRRPYLIVIGKRDAPAGRLFSLWYEYAHVLLASSRWYAGRHSVGPGDVERWCNAFAGEFLVPEELVLQGLSGNADIVQDTGSADRFVTTTAARLRVSAQAVFYRVADLLSIPSQVQKELDSLYRNRSASQKPKTSSSQKPEIPGHVTQRYKYGSLYARVVLNARDAGAIGDLDVAGMPGLRVKRHQELASLVFGE